MVSVILLTGAHYIYKLVTLHYYKPNVHSSRVFYCEYFFLLKCTKTTSLNYIMTFQEEDPWFLHHTWRVSTREPTQVFVLDENYVSEAFQWLSRT